MKLKMKTVFLTSMALIAGTMGVNAAPQRIIDTSACETVYTNYYFFLDANTTDYFKNGTSGVYHSTIGEFNNNTYRISNFDANNVGYGSVDISRSSSTSRDGITSMSLNDYYTWFDRVSNASNGVYTSGNSNYIGHQGWYSIDANGNRVYRNDGLSLSGTSKQAKINASLNANVKLTLENRIDSKVINPFDIRIDRSYYGSLTNAPVAVGNHDWYLQPAIFYIQYCEPKREEPEVEKYTVTYHGNGSGVTNVPSSQSNEVGSCIRIGSAPSRNGYKFVGWSTKSTAVDMAWMPGDSYCGTKGDLDLYAIWEKIQDVPVDTYYTIRYDANTTDRVTGMPSAFTQNSNYDTFISTNIPSRDGYEFVGWNPDRTATTENTDYRGGSTYSDRKDLTLYAIWKKVGGNDTPNLPSNPATGITDYLLPFGGVVSASGLGLGLLKKKKGFKQF